MTRFSRVVCRLLSVIVIDRHYEARSAKAHNGASNPDTLLDCFAALAIMGICGHGLSVPAVVILFRIYPEFSLISPQVPPSGQKNGRLAAACFPFL